MPQKRVNVVITGEVQGVGYRISCQRQAQALGVNGWVRNRWDGAVEGLFEGSAEAVDALVGWCRHGPPSAEVTQVEVSDAPPGPPQRSFYVRA